MRLAPGFEFPPELARVQHRARRLAWWTIAYLISVGVVLYLVLGASQAMKAAWLEDMLSIVPPVAFLIGDRFAARRPNLEYPYGFHRAASVAFLVAAGALFVLGAWLIVDSTLALIDAEHPTIGAITLSGETFWLGWLMIAALLYSGIPPAFIGRIQARHARQLRDKTLYAGAMMRKADWLTATAAIVGVLGIGYGFWWADAVAAIVISLDILRDGWRHLNAATTDLLDRQPRTVEGKPSDMPRQARDFLRSLDWVETAEVRLREAGHLVLGEAFVVPRSREDLPRRIVAASESLRARNWRFGQIVIMPVERLTERESESES